jgi:hypothetical protein
MFVFTDNRMVNWRQEPHRFVAVLLMALFPPFLALCKVQLNVYEEAVGYGYICAAAMFLGTLAFVQRPRLHVYLLLCSGAGLLAFVRPTIGIYGFASLVVAWFVTRRAGWKWWQSLAGPALFGVGIMLLLWTNQQRFGSYLEFGHRLNLSATNSEFVTRFANPYEKEPLWSATRELLGSMFFTPELNGFDSFRDDAVRWQSPTVRYRAIYHTTFDWTFLVGLVACWALALRSAWFWRKTRKLRPQDIMVMTAGAWALLTFIPLFLFYLRFAFIFSRYLADFSPAIVAAMFGSVTGLWSLWCERGPGSLRSSWPAFVVFGIALSWWSIETLNLKATKYGETLRQIDVLNVLQRNAASPKPLPTRYAIGDDLPQIYGIPYNGEGWLPTGEVRCVVTLFVRDLNQLSLELESASSTPLSDADCATIRAMVGAEYLRQESVQTTARGKRVIFAPPGSQTLRRGVQVAFVAFASAESFHHQDPPFKLMEAHWTRSGAD